MEQIDEKKLKDIGFVYGDFPEMVFPLNEETSLVLAYAETKWYAFIRQYKGLKPPVEEVYIPKDIVSMRHVYLLIACLSDFGEGSYFPKSWDILSKKIKQYDSGSANIPSPPPPPFDRKLKEGGYVAKPKDFNVFKK